MSVSPTSASFNLLTVFWGVSLTFMGVSILCCVAIIVRRMWRNRRLAIRKVQRDAYQDFILEELKKDPLKQSLSGAPACHIEEITSVFLDYFRALKGETHEQLKNLISGSQVEEQIVKSAGTGVRGVRMRAVRTLSYLGSQTSLTVIFENLSSDDKYIRLTAARCLVRRKAVSFLNAIVDSCVEAFPQDFKLIAGILSEFGPDVVEPLETVIKQTHNNTVKTAGLEALVLIMPPVTSLDMDALMANIEPSVRAATLALSDTAKHESSTDIFLLGLKDDAIAVKMRALKMAHDFKRSDLISDLYALSNDPVMWVRYWALRSIWATGQSGEKFIHVLNKTNPMAKDVALEMDSGYV